MSARNPSACSWWNSPLPQVPSPAERAKTIATRSEQAVIRLTTFHGTAATDSPASLMLEKEYSPWLHHVHESGGVSVLLPDGHPLTAFTWQARQGIEVLLELIDHAPVPLREPTRGLVWISGWLRPLDRAVARAQAVNIAETRPDHRLLDLGHGAELFRLSPTSLVLADSEGTHSLRPHNFSAARADPFHAYERLWLPHLEQKHGQALIQLASALPAHLRGERIRPLSLDRLGLRLRVETDNGDHDVRLPFSHSVECLATLRAELQKLLQTVRDHSGEAI